MPYHYDDLWSWWCFVLIMSNQIMFVGFRTPIPFTPFSPWNPDYLHSVKRWIWLRRSSVPPDYLHSSKRWWNQDDHDDHDDHRQPQIIYTHPSQREICGLATGSVLRRAPVTNRSFLNNLRAFVSTTSSSSQPSSSKSSLSLSSSTSLSSSQTHTRCYHVILWLPRPPFVRVKGEKNWSATKQRTPGYWWFSSSQLLFLCLGLIWPLKCV